MNEPLRRFVAEGLASADSYGFFDPLRVAVFLNHAATDEEIEAILSFPEITCIIEKRGQPERRAKSGGKLLALEPDMRIPESDILMCLAFPCTLDTKDIVILAAVPELLYLLTYSLETQWSLSGFYVYLNTEKRFNNYIPQKFSSLTDYFADAMHCLKGSFHADDTFLVYMSSESSLEEIHAILTFGAVNAIIMDRPSLEAKAAFPGRIFSVSEREHIPQSDIFFSFSMPAEICGKDIERLGNSRYFVAKWKGEWSVGLYPDNELSDAALGDTDTGPTPNFAPVQPADPAEAKIGAARDLLRRVPLLPGSRIIPDRALLVTGTLGSGGAERQLAMTVNGLKKRGWNDIHILAHGLHNRQDCFYLPLLKESDSCLHELPYQVCATHSAQAWFPNLPQMAKQLHEFSEASKAHLFSYLAMLYELRPAVLHVWMDIPEAALAGCLAGVPRVILSWQNTAPYQFPYYNNDMLPLYKALQERSSVKFTNNSRAGREDYAQWIGMNAERITVLYNGIDPKMWRRPDPRETAALKRSLDIPSGAPVVGALARFSYEKDLELWVRTAALIARQRKDVHFVIFGEGPLAGETKSLAKTLGLSRRLHCPGVNRNAAVAHSISDIFLMTSRTEGVPNVLLEAQLLGVPVVTTRAGGAPEAIRPGITGVIVEERVPERLADAVCALLANTAWCERARIEGPVFVTDKFCMEHMLDTTLDVYGWSRYA